MIAHKFYSDDFYSNNYISFVGGLQLEEINFLEREFLMIIDYNLTISTDEYQAFDFRLNQFLNQHNHQPKAC